MIFCLILLMVGNLWAEYNVVSYDAFVQKIGMLWNRITNHGEFGDDSYSAPEPSCEWPGGSGNSYLYAGTLWLSGAYKVGSSLRYSVLNERDGEYAAIDSIHVIKPGVRSEQDTYTSFWDVAGTQTGEPDPLGVVVKERTYAWSNPIADDFIIVEYTIINVGLDGNGDYQPDIFRDLYNFTFTIRMDGDVAKRADWPVEDQRVNQDDHALSNANATFTIDDAIDPDYNGSYSGWDWVTLVPYMRRQVEAEPFMLDSLETYPLDSMMTFMWDGDNLNVSAEDWGLEESLLPLDFDYDYIDDDFGNPDIDGSFNSAGFLGWRMLRSYPEMKPKSYVTCTIHDDPEDDDQRWNDYININDFHNITEAVNPIYSQWQDGYFYPEDYRTLTSYGSLDTLKAGDSVVVTMAYGVGGDQLNGGIYSLIELNKIMLMAQYIVDNDYNIDLDELVAPPAEFSLQEVISEGSVNISWDEAPEAHNKFNGYRIIRCNSKQPNGTFIWDELVRFEEGTENWPPPSNIGGSSSYIYEDTTAMLYGFDYYYCVQTISNGVPGYGTMYSTEGLYKSLTPTSVPSVTLDDIKVVPNPYIGSASWNNRIPSSGTSPWEHQLMFINLPDNAIINIYTLDGDYVAQVKESDARVSGPNETLPDKREGTAIWDLVTRNNQDAAPGVYLYTVSSDIGKKVGKFVIIR